MMPLPGAYMGPMMPLPGAYVGFPGAHMGQWQWVAAPPPPRPPPPPPPLPKAPFQGAAGAALSAAVAAPPEAPPAQESASEGEEEWAGRDEHIDIVFEEPEGTTAAAPAKASRNPTPKPPATPPPQHLQGKAGPKSERRRTTEPRRKRRRTSEPRSKRRRTTEPEEPEQPRSKRRRFTPQDHWSFSAATTLCPGDDDTNWSLSPAEALVRMPDKPQDGVAASYVRLHDNAGLPADFVERPAPLANFSGDWRTQDKTEAGERVPRGPVFNLATAVVTARATKEDVYNLVNRCTANILIIIWDPLLLDVLNVRQAGRSCGPAAETLKADLAAEGIMKTFVETHSKLRRHFEDAACEASLERERLWGPGGEKPAQDKMAYWKRGPDLLQHTGLVFFQPRVVKEISLANTDIITKDGEHVNTVLKVTLREWKKNPGAQFHVAVPARYQFSKETQWRLNGKWTHDNDWSTNFQEDLVDDVWRLKVRFLTGFFDCAPKTIRYIGEKCGLSHGDKPFHVTFHTDDGIAIHPNFMFVLGAHDPQHPVYRGVHGDLDQDAVSMPHWLYPQDADSQWKTWFNKFKKGEVPTWGTAPMCEPQLRLQLKDAARQVLRHRELRRPSGKTPDDEGEDPPPDPNETARNEHLARKREARWMEQNIAPDDPVENSYYLPPPLPSLGKVASKRLRQEHFDQYWCEGIHLNMIFVGQSQPSANSRANKTRIWKMRGGKNRQAAVAASTGRARRAERGHRDTTSEASELD